MRKNIHGLQLEIQAVSGLLHHSVFYVHLLDAICMEYNTTRPHLRYTEYGRIIKSYVDYILTIQDREKRSRAARQVVDMMMMANPQFKHIEEYKHKLWDHLHIMSDFRLDVDAPYPIPPREAASFKRPEPMTYPDGKIKNRTFGKNFERFMERATQSDDPEKLKGFAEAAAYYIKLAYLNWNNEHVTDDSVKADLARMSDNKLSVDETYNLDNVKGGTAYQQNYALDKKKTKKHFKKPFRSNGGGKKFFKKR